MDSNEQGQILNFLYAVCSDRLEQYRNAQEEIKDVQLKELFRQSEQESAEMMAQIHQLLGDLGIAWEEQSTLSGDLHNLWIDFRSKISGHDNKAIVEALLCAEEANLKKYHQECQNSQYNDEEVQKLIQQQHTVLTQAVNRLTLLATKEETENINL